ncbi:cysteine proteinase [Cylindrobasidium torrendii FP15055 ss-10]|uniref:Ubiquitin carboxyl-terminal hydrolase n=1 Tax=Cylindrobasidium torrendii FP15055 ss-10 TaxID=1314674 RepID=A0A0D7BRA8_9AGAR|nr:cysteine proteinase [Cylindrobasidium torrendii FP15055 ss-10]
MDEDAPDGLISTCSHVGEILVEGSPSMARYERVVSASVHLYKIVRVRPKRRKASVSVPVCGSCQQVITRPSVCFDCGFTACWGDHMLDHLDNTGHAFCVDVKSGQVYCDQCEDFIYHPMLDTIYLAATSKAEQKETPFKVSKKPIGPSEPWVPSLDEQLALAGGTPVPCQARKGLLNLGQTCFMNVVLQCLVHNPLIRNFFLSDQHNHHKCTNEDCSCCEMDKLIQEIYSENNDPYGPVSFLTTIWKKAPDLAGYSQHDAHELFLSVLNLLHGTSKGATNVSCNCIVHSTFAGQYQSDIKCERCGSISSATDPLFDVSLELKDETDLSGCLKRFTQSERLAAKDYACAKCAKSGKADASKRMSILKLPPVLTFQFKRYEQKTSDKTRKLDTQVRFPARLNMAPYTSVMKDNDKENVSNLGPQIMYEYDLFAVINHEGNMSTGHYTNYARFGDEWYRFDDDKVTVASLGACLASNPYMCFYVKRRLEYKAHARPSYVISKESEAARAQNEKERMKNQEIDDELLAVI